MRSRPLTPAERGFIRAVAAQLEPSRQQRLEGDLDRAEAHPAPDGARIAFFIDGYERPPYRGQHTYGIDGQVLDADGAVLTVILYADENDHLLEMELIRWDPQSPLGPNWATLRLV